MKRQHRTTIHGMYGMNITPLMDLTFLLLITFIITFPLMEQGIPVNLPRGQAKPVEAAPSVTITVDKDGRCFWDMDLIVTEALAERLAQSHAANPEIRLILRGDTDANYGKVVEIAALAKKTGIKSLSLAMVEN